VLPLLQLPGWTFLHCPCDNRQNPPQVVSKDIRRILAERARYFNIILEDVSITQVWHAAAAAAGGGAGGGAAVAAAAATPPCYSSS
jgi:hypothetical protein